MIIGTPVVRLAQRARSPPHPGRVHDKVRPPC
jgi:hypothetical protein